jgi:hypothetical protein
MTATRIPLREPSATSTRTHPGRARTLADGTLSIARRLGRVGGALSTFAWRGQLGASEDKTIGRHTGARV